MEPNKGLPQSRLDKLIEEISQLQFHLSQHRGLLKQTAQEVNKEDSRVEELKKEITVLLQDPDIKDKNSDKFIETINSLNNSLQTRAAGKEELLSSIKKLQAVEIPQQEAKLGEIKEQIKSAQPELADRLKRLEGITQETATANKQLNELSEKNKDIDKNLFEYKTLYQEILEEIKSLDARFHPRSEEKKKILDAIEQLRAVEIPEQEAKLEEMKKQIQVKQPELKQGKDTLEKITQEIASANKKHDELLLEIHTLKQRYQEQVPIYEGLPKETASLEMLILERTQEKQRVLDKIENLKIVELPQQEAKTKEIKEQIQQMQSEIRQKQEPLAQMTQEIPLGIQRLKALEAKEDILKKEYQSLEQSRQELAQKLNQLEAMVAQKRMERDKVIQWTSQVESGINQYTELKETTKETTRLLLDELQRRKEMYGLPAHSGIPGQAGDMVPTPVAPNQRYIPEVKPIKREDKKPLISTEEWKTVFVLFLIILMLGILGVLIWGLFNQKII